MMPSMEPRDRIGDLLQRLWHHIGPRRRVQFVLLVVLMIVTSACEVATIGAVVPFLMALTDPQKIQEFAAVQSFINVLGIRGNEQLLLSITVIFVIISLLAAAMRTTLLWATSRYTCMTGADISINIYRRTLYQPYLTHVARNTSEVISGISVKANHIIGYVIGPGLTLMSATLMLFGIMLTLLAIDYVIALTAFSGFAVIYSLIFMMTREKLAANSKQNTIDANLVFKALQEGLGGIRDVLIDGAQNTYCEVYRNADSRMRKTQANMLFISQWPRYMLEGLGTALIAVIAFGLAREKGGLNNAIPFLGALAIGAQRLLPIAQQTYASWSSIYSSSAQLKETLLLLDQPISYHVAKVDYEPLHLHYGISLNQIGFRYLQTSPWVLKDLSLFIPKGSRLGVMGETGSGKSTFLDILMGLLIPEEGVLKIDDTAINEANMRGWQSAIAHVPQAIFLTDSTVAENIAFGIPRIEIDMSRVKEAARKAQLSDVIESWPAQYETMVGERGVKLSGGQRQRVGIARALYKRAEVIVFDEATSALDSNTEDAVMAAVQDLGSDLTLIIIAHRLTTLRICDQVIEIGKQGILRKGSYAQIIGSRDANDHPSTTLDRRNAC